MTSEQLSQILQSLRQALSETLGDRFEGAYLFGSQARGDASRESDIDVLVVVRGKLDYRDLIRRTSAVVAELSLQHDVVISRSFVSRARFRREKSPFLINVRREAVAI